MSLFTLYSLLALGCGSSAERTMDQLLQDARVLLHKKQPAKALVLLERARRRDARQLELDRLVRQCQQALGEWVSPPGTGGNWLELDSLDDVHNWSSHKADSVLRRARDLAAGENLEGAIVLYRALARRQPVRIGLVDEWQEVVAVQEQRVRQAIQEGDGWLYRAQWDAALTAYRQGLVAHSQDPTLLERLERVSTLLQGLRARTDSMLAQQKGAQQWAAALRTVDEALVDFPGDALFLEVRSELRARVQSEILRTLQSAEALFAQGAQSQARAVLDSLWLQFPNDPLVRGAWVSWQVRHARREQIQADSLRSLQRFGSSQSVVSPTLRAVATPRTATAPTKHAPPRPALLTAEAARAPSNAAPVDYPRVVRYRLQPRESLGYVAKKFYGNRGLGRLLMEWNGWEDPRIVGRLLVGQVVEVPLFKDIKGQNLSLETVRRAFPKREDWVAKGWADTLLPPLRNAGQER